MLICLHSASKYQTHVVLLVLFLLSGSEVGGMLTEHSFPFHGLVLNCFGALVIKSYGYVSNPKTLFWGLNIFIIG